jgi:integrase
VKVRFTLRKPDRVRRTFSIDKDILYVGGRREHAVVEDSALEAVNSAYKSGQIDATNAEMEIRNNILPRLRSQAGIKDKILLEAQISDNNLKIFKKFWKAEYETRLMEDPGAARREFIRALRAVEPLSLVSASKSDFFQQIQKTTTQNNPKRKVIIRINQLLRYLKKGFQLDVPSIQYLKVKYLSVEELRTLLVCIEGREAKLLVCTLFGTGARIGEAFCFDERCLLPNNSVLITHQMKIDGKIAGIKNKKEHKSVVLPEFLEEVKEWCSIEDKRKHRNSLARQISRAAKRAFPKNKAKQITPHDLRHSFAVHMLSLRATFTEIAMLLGDDEITVRKHYIGYELTDVAIDRVQSLFNNSRAKFK